MKGAAILSVENLTKEPRFFYGWVILAACFSATVVLGGVLYSFGVFFNPLLEEFGWSRALTSSVNTVSLVAFGVSLIILGRMTDKYGPKIVLAFGGTLISGGFALCSQVDSISLLYLCYVILGLGSGAAWVLPTATIQRWFLKGRGLTLGIVSSGVGLGAFIFAPIASYLIDVYGWRTSYLIIGVFTFTVTNLSASVLVISPGKKGLKPYGKNDLASSPTDELADTIRLDEIKSKLITDEKWTPSELLRTWTFYGICFIDLFSVLPLYMIAVHVVPYATDIGISRVLAASALGLIGCSNIAGRIVIGGATEKIDFKTALAISCFLCSASVLFLIGARSIEMLYVFAIVYGFFYGGKVTLIPGLIGFFYGTESLATLIGTSHSLAIFGGAGGPILAGYLFDRTGSYTVAFLLAAGSFFISGAFTVAIKPPKKAPVNQDV